MMESSGFQLVDMQFNCSYMTLGGLLFFGGWCGGTMMHYSQAIEHMHGTIVYLIIGLLVDGVRGCV